jgi:hypothetical protein
MFSAAQQIALAVTAYLADFVVKSRILQLGVDVEA